MKKWMAGLGAWTALVTALHLGLNFDWDAFLNGFRPAEARKLNVGYIPVT
jgi:hypothetical protein